MRRLPWFRLYSEAVDDEKLRLIAFEDRWHFVALLCCKAQGILDEAGDLRNRKVAVKLGLSVRELEEVARRLSEVGLIDAKTLQPLAWDHRQFKSDSSLERVRAYRERVKRDCNVTVTAQETETDTEKETPPIGGVRAETKKAQTRIPDDWQPDKRALDWIASFGVTLEQAAPVIHEFKTYWGGRSQRRADWSLAFIRNGKVEGSLIKLRDSANGPHQKPDTRSRAQRHHDKLREIAERSIARERGAS